MKTLATVLGLAVAMVAAPAWAASSGSLHAMSKVSAASALSSDELSAVEGGIIVTGPNSFETPINSPTITNFLTQVLAQQFGVPGAQPILVQNTTIVPSFNPFTGGITFTPVTRVQVNTLTCVGCTGL